ncbi:MAG: 5'/3'-nucleotidase SurE [Flavobacteriaceae bacterium]|nr:5'/3'-nucleotidase SurE [Flavobacteriaceae bacterium]
MQTDTRPLILVTNDDGITAPGIRALVDAIKDLGQVVIIAPDSPQSGMGHAITISKPLRVERNDVFKGFESYQCSGTPVDCVKLGHHQVLDRLPDLVVSGINHGSNASINIIYSGTMSAAVEAAVEGIPAVGFSLCDYAYHADFEPCKPFVKSICQNILEKGLPDGVLLNVNFPKADVYKGLKVCRQARAKWKEDFDQRIDPNGRKYYWLVGKFINMEMEAADTDQAALDAGYVSVVPTQFDLTSHSSIDLVRDWKM